MLKITVLKIITFLFSTRLFINSQFSKPVRNTLSIRAYIHTRTKWHTHTKNI